jgi:hypothetical protein
MYIALVIVFALLVTLLIWSIFLVYTVQAVFYEDITVC